MSLTDMVGYSALIINLYSMTRSQIGELRLFSIIANSIYIVYGFLLMAFPLIIGCSIAVGLHGFHFLKPHLKNKNKLQ